MDRQRARHFEFIPGRGQGPLTIEAAEGAYLVAEGGLRLLDAAGGAIVANVGHGREEVAEAVRRATLRTSYVLPPFATEERLRLVERLTRAWLPPGLDRVFFTSGGSESIDAAVRLARLHHYCAGRPERWKVIGRDLSYHGTTLSTLSVGGSEKRRKAYGPLLAPSPKAPAHYCLRCPLGKRPESCGVACVDEIERLFEREGVDSIAAVIAEPVAGSTLGALVPPEGYWRRLRELCTRHGVLLIADEVMSGFGRTGARFAVDQEGVVPDILVGGKGLSGGYAPLGGVYTSDAIVAPIATSEEELMFYTYAGHPAACAAADAVLEIMEREQLVERAARLGALLGERLASLRDHPHVAQVRGRGLLQAVEVVSKRETLEPFPAELRITQRIVAAGFRRGVLFYPGGAPTTGAVVLLGPPFIVTEAELDTMVQVLAESIDEAVAKV